MTPTSGRRLRSLLGQLRYPREFRVPPPPLDPDQADWATELLAQLAALEAAASRATTPEPAGAPAEPGESGKYGESGESGESGEKPETDALLRAASGLWRAGRQLDEDGGTLSGAGLRQVRRQLNASRRALVDGGLEIQDHEGQRFDSGLSLEVLLFQEEPGLAHEVVLETVRPSVYFRGRCIQMGQVIVGRPASEQTTPDS